MFNLARKPAAPAPDPFFEVNTALYGQAEVRRRETADHEAIHAAAADALGLTIKRVEVSAGGITGSCEYNGAALPDEKLVIAVAPIALGAAGHSAGDARDSWDLARQ